MVALLLQETFFDQGVYEAGGPLGAFPHGLDQFPHRESRGPQEGPKDQAPDLAIGIAKGGLALVVGASAVGIGGGALQHSPVIHQGIVPGAGMLPVQGLIHQGQDFPVPDPASARKEAVEKDPANVGLDEHHRLVEGEGGQGPGGGLADAGKGAEGVNRGGEAAVKIRRQSPGDALQGQGAAIIPQSCQAPIMSRREARARDQTSGKALIKGSYLRATRSTWVCCSMISETRM